MPPLTILVLAKAPVAGRSKTRLCPPFTPVEAAELAEAALRDTLAAALATPGTGTLLALDGTPGPWLPPGVDVLPQRGDGLAARIGAALHDAQVHTGTPVLLVGMDTPQLTPALLAPAAHQLLRPHTDAVLGLAADGGWWALGIQTADADLLVDVPMSVSTTGADTRDRLRSRGLRTRDLPTLRDVDTATDAAAVAAMAPGTRFAQLLGLLGEAAA